MRALAALACLAAFARAAPAEPLESRLPPDTLVCVTLEDTARSRERLDRGRWAALRGEPAAQRLALRVAYLLDRALEQEARAGRPWPGPLWEIAEGRLVCAVVRAGGAPRPLVLVEVGDRFEEALADLHATGALGRRRVDGPFTEHAGSGEEGPVGSLWHARFGGTVAVAWDRAALAALVTPGDASLAGQAQYRLVRGALEPDADATVYLSGAALAEWDRGGALLRLLGAGPASAAGASLALRDGGLALRAFLHLPAGDGGLLRLLRGADGALAPPPFLPGGTRSFTLLRLDAGRFVRGLHDALAASGNAELARAVPADVDAFLEAAGGAGARALFDSLGDEFAAAELLPGRPRIEMARLARPAPVRRMLAGLPCGDAEGVRWDLHGNAFLLRDGWIAGARGGRDDLRLLAADAEGPGLAGSPPWRRATAALPVAGLALWYERPDVTRRHEDWRALVLAQAGVLRCEPEGLSLAHFVALR